MKKLIAIAVVFALVAGVAFAVDIGGTVIGVVDVLKGSDPAAKNADGDDMIEGGAYFKRIRLEGSGDTGEGKFGGWFRFDPSDKDAVYDTGDIGNHLVAGMAWWKPIDQLKITIGGNPDGIWGKEGVTGWMFGQTAYDSGVTLSELNVWDGTGVYGQGLKTRNAFFRGFGAAGLLLEIKPLDMIGINIALPFFAGGELKDIFSNLVAQVEVNLDFGNIAISYEGEASYIQNGNITGWGNNDGGTLFGYFGLAAIDNLGLDIGFGFELPNKDDGPAKDLKNPFAAGLGLKYTAGAFGVKLRTVMSFPTTDKDDNEAEPFKVFADLLPYYAINDTTRVFLGFGLGIRAPKDDDAVTGFYINPWLEVGEEWGAKFVIGLKIWSDGVKGADDKTTTNWALPMGIIVSF
jgi:hypothetical protein